MAKEHFKFESQEWMAEELIPETTGKIGMKHVRNHFVGSRYYSKSCNVYCSVWT